MPTYNTSVPGPGTAKKLPHIIVWGESKFTKGIGIGATIRPEGLVIDRNIAPFDIPSYFSLVVGGRKWVFHDTGTVTEPAPTTGQIWPRRRHGN